MQKDSKNIEKPRAEIIRPEITSLPELTEERLRYRKKWASRSRKLIKTLTRAEYFGLENFPTKGPGLIISNHLGDLDMILGLSIVPIQAEAVGTTDLYDIPIVGNWLKRYGIIWIHRGTPDRKALRSILQGLSEGRLVAIAPEGRESVTGALEKATDGAAYIALRAKVPIIPIALTGTESSNIFGSWRRFKRPRLTLTIGEPFSLDDIPKKKGSMHLATEKMMLAIAKLLPVRYRGFYKDKVT